MVPLNTVSVFLLQVFSLVGCLSLMFLVMLHLGLRRMMCPGALSSSHVSVAGNPLIPMSLLEVGDYQRGTPPLACPCTSRGTISIP